MGAAACKNSKSTEQKSDNKDNKIITIGVFGLDDAGKTTTVKAIEGNPTADVEPTQGSATSTIDNPNKGGKSESVKLIDVCGSKKYRDKLWPPFYKQIHGLIYVFDASEKKRFRENQEVFETLLDHDDLRGKPILILANKQDDRDALKHEDTIRKKLAIEQLKTKHKIELCTAVPTSKKSSTDPSIRDGISWLIKTIEADYNALNARVNPSSANAPQTPKQRGKTNRSNSDSDEIYPKRRHDSPLGQKNKLAPLDLNRKKTTPRNGHDTYDENDDDSNFTRQRPKISEFDSRRSASPPLTTSSDFHKKKTTAGNTFGLRGHTNDTNAKPFRTSFETLPEEAPWSMSSNRSTKTDNNFLKPTTSNPWSSDASKRDRSPSFREPKVPPLALPSKRGNLSDDDDISYGQTSKQKPLMNSNNRLKDPYDDNRLSSSSRPFSAAKKPSSGIYGADDDDDDDKFGKKDFKKPGITTGSKTGKDPDFDNDIGKRLSRPWDRTSGLDDYRGSSPKGGPLPSTSTFGAGRSKSGGDPYPSSLTKPDSKWKSSTDDLPPLSSKSFGHSASPVKPSIGSKLHEDDDDDDGFPPSHKATARSRSPGDPYGSSWKPPTTSKYASQSDSSSPYKSSAPFKSTVDDRPATGSKFGSRSKLTDDYPSISSPNPLRSRFGDMNRAASPSKPSLTSKFNDDEKDSYRNPSTRATSQLKPIDDLSSKSAKTSLYGDVDDKYDTSFKRGGTRPNFDNKDSASSLSKGKPTNKYGDDDDDDKYSPSSKFTTKPKMTSKFSDDDDDDKYGSSSKSMTKPKMTSKFSDDDDDKYNPSSKFTAKPKTTFKFSDDDDDKYKSPSKPISKPKTSSKYSDDDDKYSSPSKTMTKPKTTSMYSDDDDDKYGSSSKSTTKAKTTSKYSDDDDKYSSPSKSMTKPKTKSIYSDDDDDKYSSPSKSTTKPKTTSKYSDDDDKYSSPSKLTTKPKTTSKYSDDDDDKYGSSSKTTSKPKTTSKYSDDDDKYSSPSKSTTKPKVTSKYSDDDDDKYSSPSKSTSKPKTTSKYSDDDDDKYGSSSKTTSKPKTTSKYSDDDDDNKYNSSSKSTAYPSKSNSSARFGGYSGSGGIGSRYD